MDEIRAAAFEMLAADPGIRSTHIHVNVSHGHLTLTGYVREQAESAAAAEDAASLSRVIEVTYRIENPVGSGKMSAATSRLRGGHGSLWRRHRRATAAVFALLVAVAFAYYALPHIVSLGPTLGRLRQGRVAWLAIGVALEVCSLFGEVGRRLRSEFA